MSMLPIHRYLHGLLAALALAGSVAPASAASVIRPISGVGTGGLASGGGLEPIGDGRFRVSGREYQARLTTDDTVGCFRGSMRVSEEAILSVPNYAGSHEGYIEISAESGMLLLRYRGDVSRYAGKGDWWVVRGVGACADLTGSGSYASVFRTGPDTQYRLELRGRVSLND
jgi:hypothetical protein